MTSSDDLLNAFDEVITDGVRRGMLHNIAEDTRLDGRTVTLDGRRLVNFGSCSYLGLEMHPALKAAVTHATDRFGTQFSSSRAYLSAPLYRDAEARLGELFGRPTIITPSTTMGHLATIPTVVGAKDAMIIDHQAHHSVQTAAKLARANGSTVELLPHSDMARLDRRISELARSHRKVWYLADGLYSMYADHLPIDAVNELVDRHEQLWLYLDDAHSVSWSGQWGRGYVLERLSPAAAGRAVVAASLNKSFAAAGGAITLPDEETRRRVFTVGGPLIFSGPVQPPMLGAVLASAAVHMSPELPPLQQRLRSLISLFNRLADARGLPLTSRTEAPIRCIGAGTPDIAYGLTGRLRDAGFFADTATYPAVAARRSGARLTITTHHTEQDIADVVDALAAALPAALAEGGSSPATLERAFAKQLAGRPVLVSVASPPPAPPRAGLRLEQHTTIASVEPAEWDALLGDRGAFTWNALRTVEDAFAGPAAEREHTWRFHYWIVRDDADGGRPVAATFFTTALWKDDMLSEAGVSAAIEQHRGAEPYHLTSVMVGMGSLLSEGDHLYLDRTADWRAALRLILDAARAEEDRAGASGVVLRDLGDGDGELHEFLVGEGFARVPVMDTWVREVDFVDDEQFLASLRKKARYHQRANVLSREPGFRFEAIEGGSARAAELSEAQVDHLYRLYRNVHARNLELNVFPLPRRVFDAVLRGAGWELSLLYVPELPDVPVAFAVQHVTAEHVQPLFVGLDYAYVASHGTYQQTLWQAIRSAQRRGAPRVLFGMSAGLQKSRFGARPERRWAYVQSTNSYQADALQQVAETLAAA